MDISRLNEKARQLRSLHSGAVLVLPNVWDAGSAMLVGQAGARAIATTSGGVSWSRGRQDGQQLTRQEMIAAIGPIVDAVDLPVTVDVEGGYGPEPEAVARTVAAVLAAGAVGINLEDSGCPDGSLFTADAQAERIRAARAAAQAAGVPDFVINARTDVVLFEIGESEARLDDVRSRADHYAAAGADCLFVPGLLDLSALEAVVASSSIPVNAMAGPGGPSVGELAAVGVRRVSVGTALAQLAYSETRRAAIEILEHGTFTVLESAAGFGELNSLFSSK